MGAEVLGRPSPEENGVSQRRFCSLNPDDYHGSKSPRVLTEEDIESRGSTLFVAEVALMFSGLFLVMAPLWIHVLYYMLAFQLAIVVLQTARSAARVIPASVPMQRPIGVALYLSSQTMLLFMGAALPMAMVAYVLIALPLALILLFD